MTNWSKIDLKLISIGFVHQCSIAKWICMWICMSSFITMSSFNSCVQWFNHLFFVFCLSLSSDEIRSRNFWLSHQSCEVLSQFMCDSCLICHIKALESAMNNAHTVSLRMTCWKIATKMSSFVYRRCFVVVFFTYKCSTVETPKLFCLL